MFSLISFDRSGYVILFEIEDKITVTILAVRHQRKEERLDSINDNNAR
ncbi:MAG: type II toxin-antitoxin system RelE/ParE family toxin [Deltaproteobacteria bacterium]|nr:type II toxin-antitoxin system RelE/ParE family toxin [Deltaproteobacteria bacterium]